MASFQNKYLSKYPVEINARDTKGSVVSISCKLCKFFGREEPDAVRKRRRTTNMHTWKAPYRPAQFEKHYESQHTLQWKEWSEASKDERLNFFEGAIDRRNTLHNHMDIDEDVIKFTIDAPIVKTIIEDMMFCTEDELAAEEVDHDQDAAELDAAKTVAKALNMKKNAMKLFNLVHDENEAGANQYVVKIKNTLRFQLCVDFVATGISFRQTAAALDRVKVRAKVAKLTGVHDYMVGNY